MRPPEGVQRGSVVDMPIVSRRSAHAGRRRDEGCQAARRWRGADAHEDSRAADLVRRRAAAARRARRTGGAGDVARRAADHVSLRPGRRRASTCKLKFDWSLKTLYDVIARLPGTTEADEWVIRGNHHDAWVNGAEDPISGLVAELEEARALGEL